MAPQSKQGLFFVRNWRSPNPFDVLPWRVRPPRLRPAPRSPLTSGRPGRCSLRAKAGRQLTRRFEAVGQRSDLVGLSTQFSSFIQATLVRHPTRYRFHIPVSTVGRVSWHHYRRLLEALCYRSCSFGALREKAGDDESHAWGSLEVEGDGEINGVGYLAPA